AVVGVEDRVGADHPAVAGVDQLDPVAVGPGGHLVGDPRRAAIVGDPIAVALASGHDPVQVVAKGDAGGSRIAGVAVLLHLPVRPAIGGGDLRAVACRPDV